MDILGCPDLPSLAISILLPRTEFIIIMSNAREPFSISAIKV